MTENEIGKGCNMRAPEQWLPGKGQRVRDAVVNSQGKYRVLGLDKWNDDDWSAGQFDTAEEAIAYARSKTDSLKVEGEAPCDATVFYAYSPEGFYLNGKQGKRD